MKIIRVEYKTDEEKQTIITDNSSLFLWREENIAEGNFLTFADRERMKDEEIITK